MIEFTKLYTCIDFDNLPTQLSHMLQCDARGGRKILHVKQYFSLMTCPLISTSICRAGGRYTPGSAVCGAKK